MLTQQSHSDAKKEVDCQPQRLQVVLISRMVLAKNIHLKKMKVRKEKLWIRNNLWDKQVKIQNQACEHTYRERKVCRAKLHWCEALNSNWDCQEKGWHKYCRHGKSYSSDNIPMQMCWRPSTKKYWLKSNQ